MAWDAGQYDFIYEGFSRLDMGFARGGDQEYISTALARAGQTFTPIQDELTGVYSYKRQCRTGPPPDARVICFHGRPRVHECQDKWVREVWR